MVIKEEQFPCIHVCLHFIQHIWIKHINHDFPCIPFLKNSRHSNDFFNEAKRRQKILFLILIVSTNIVNVFKIWALPVFGWFNECIICIFFPCDSTKEELENKRDVCAATSTAVEGIYHMPISNLCIPSNFGIVRCEGIGREAEGGKEINIDW